MALRPWPSFIGSSTMSGKQVLSGLLARIKVDEKNCFGKIECQAVTAVG